MSIRTALQTDVPSLTRLNRHVQGLHLEAEPLFFKAPPDEVVGAFFIDMLSREETRAYVAEEEGAVVGYLLGAVRERPDGPFKPARRWLQIDHISVSPAHQRRGHAGAMVSAAVECARSEGIRDLQTGVWGFNEPSLSFFKDQGFTLSEVRLRRQID